MYQRILKLPLSKSESCFFWGPRQTGKSTLLKNLFPDAKYYDLLLSDVYHSLLLKPSILREECAATGLTGSNQKHPIIIDEVQKLPELLDEVQWLIVNKGIRFILCGSSARKLRRGHSNLLGGRAVHYELLPLCSAEVPDLSLQNALNHGMLPKIHSSENSVPLLKAYAGDYLQEEIAAEALTRNIPSFARFMKISALSNSEIIVYNNIAQECGVSGPTVKEYFQILEDTLLGRIVHGYRKKEKRRVITAPKFYYFDTGVASSLTGRNPVVQGTSEFGKTFEHFIFMELTAFMKYSGKDLPITYWRTSSGLEVDFILGQHEIAIEVKSSQQVPDHELRGLRAFKEDFSPKRNIIVSLDTAKRMTSDKIEIVPWREFLAELWSGKTV